MVGFASKCSACLHCTESVRAWRCTNSLCVHHSFASPPSQTDYCLGLHAPASAHAFTASLAGGCRINSVTTPPCRLQRHASVCRWELKTLMWVGEAAAAQGTKGVCGLGRKKLWKARGARRQTWRLSRRAAGDRTGTRRQAMQQSPRPYYHGTVYLHTEVRVCRRWPHRTQ